MAAVPLAGVGTRHMLESRLYQPLVSHRMLTRHVG
jgi:hypothetical protein